MAGMTTVNVRESQVTRIKEFRGEHVKVSPLVRDWIDEKLAELQGDEQEATSDA